MRWSWMLLAFSSLSFLGFGVSPPTPDWGLMVADSRTFLAIAPWSGLFPIAALSSLIIGINLTADALAKTLGVDRAQKAPI
jgi:peptide/nickel transport system permease protein